MRLSHLHWSPSSLQLGITLQVIHRFWPVCLWSHTRNVLPPTRSQRTFKYPLESIREPNIASSHPLYLLTILILYTGIQSSSSDVCPGANKDGMLILKYIRLCVVLKKMV